MIGGSGLAGALQIPSVLPKHNKITSSSRPHERLPLLTESTSPHTMQGVSDRESPRECDVGGANEEFFNQRERSRGEKSKGV